MPLTLELPPQIEEELRQEAQKEGVSVTEHTTLLIYLALALRETQEQTPFQHAVRSMLSQHSLDSDEVASALDDVLQQCLPGVRTLPSSAPVPGRATTFQEYLRAWRNWYVHQPLPSDQVRTAAVPNRTRPNEPKRPRRHPSAMGKYAHVPGSSESFVKAKQQEIDLEDRPRS